MTKLFNRPVEERSFTIAIARGRFVWLFMAAMLLPFAASLSSTAAHSDQFESYVQSDVVQFR